MNVLRLFVWVSECIVNILRFVLSQRGGSFLEHGEKPFDVLRVSWSELACGRRLVAVLARFSLCRVAADLRGWNVRSGIDLAIQYCEAAKLPSVLRE